MKAPLTQFSKFNNFRWVEKSFSIFVPSVWKLHNPYCHNQGEQNWSPYWEPKTTFSEKGKNRVSCTNPWFDNQRACPKVWQYWLWRFQGRKTQNEYLIIVCQNLISLVINLNFFSYFFGVHCSYSMVFYLETIEVS